MRLLIVSNLYKPEPSGIGPYTGELAEWLAARGHEVRVIAANPSYPHWKRFEGYGAFAWTRKVEGGVTVHRVPNYVPKKVGGLTRMIHYGSFAVTAFFPAMKMLWWRPKVVIQVVPTLVAAPLILATAKLSGAKSWVHVQDFEVEAGFATGQLGSTGFVARAALAFERFCLRSFTRTSSISLEMCRKLAEKGRDPADVYDLRNWADINKVVPGMASDYRAEWGITTKHVALYSGSIGQKQGIDIIVDTARLLKHRTDLSFVVCGSGPERAGFEALAEGLTNIQFHELQPREKLGELLNMATIHLLPQKAGIADLVLPSKLTNMFASGLPSVIGAAEGTGLAREAVHGGLVVPPEDPPAFAAAIERLCDDKALHAEIGAAARVRAEEAWSRDAILTAFEAELVALAGPRAAVPLDRSTQAP